MTTSQPLELLAPLSGVLLALDQVPDPVFSSRVIGDGLCIDPTSQTLCAPLAGVISNIQDSGHAVSVTDDNGVQVLMHIGLDTVNLAGQGFTRLVQEGQRVEAGQAADRVRCRLRGAPCAQFADLDAGGQWRTVYAAGERCLWTPASRCCSYPRVKRAEAVGEEEGDALFSKPLTLPNTNGLHARPAAVFAQAAKGFNASIYLHKQTQSANAKSLVAIMALQTVQGDTLQVSAAGDDAEAAIQALVALLAQGCGEAVASTAEEVATVLSATLLRGVCASPGSAFGQVVQVAEPELQIAEQGAGERPNVPPWRAASWLQPKRCKRLQDDAAGSAQAEIFRAHQELLEDPTLLEQAHGLLAERQERCLCLEQRHGRNGQAVPGLGNALLAERAADLADVGQRVLKLILGIRGQRLGVARARHPDRRATDPFANRQPGYPQSAGVCHRRRRRDQPCCDPRPRPWSAGYLRCASASAGAGQRQTGTARRRQRRAAPGTGPGRDRTTGRRRASSRCCAISATWRRRPCQPSHAMDITSRSRPTSPRCRRWSKP